MSSVNRKHNSDFSDLKRLIFAFITALFIHLLLFAFFAGKEKKTIKEPLVFKVVYAGKRAKAVKASKPANTENEIKIPSLKKTLPVPAETVVPPRSVEKNNVAVVPIKQEQPPPSLPSASQEQIIETSAESENDITDIDLTGDTEDISDNNGDNGQDNPDKKVIKQDLGDNRLFIMPLEKEERTSEQILEQCLELDPQDRAKAIVLDFEFNLNSASGLPENINQVKKSGNEELDKTVGAMVSLMSFDVPDTSGKYYLSIIILLGK